MQRVTLLSRKNKRLISQTDPFFRPRPDETAIVLRQEPQILLSPALILQPAGCLDCSVAVSGCHSFWLFSITNKRSSVHLLYVRLQEGGGVSHFSIYVAEIEHKPMLLNTAMSPTVSSQ